MKLVEQLAPAMAYLLLGVVLRRLRWDVRGAVSALLTRWVIPLLIVLQVVLGQSGAWMIVGGIVALMALLLGLSRLQTRDPLRNLGHCYLNIGWLGLPVAVAGFGGSAAAVMLPAYVGSSILGNTIAAGLLASSGDWRQRGWSTLRAPPLLALGIGVLWRQCSLPRDWLLDLQQPLQLVLSVLGMAVLGMWLGGASWQRAELLQAMRDFAWRGVAWSVGIGAVIALASLAHPWVIDAAAPLLLLGLLPPAANIAVLETCYRGSGHCVGTIAWGTVLSLLALPLYCLAAAWISGR